MEATGEVQMNSTTRANLLELAACLRAYAIDGKTTRYPGGEDEVVHCPVIGSPGACWAFLHPEAFDFKYWPPNIYCPCITIEIKCLELPEEDIVDYLPRHIGLTDKEFFDSWKYSTPAAEIASNFEELGK